MAYGLVFAILIFLSILSTLSVSRVLKRSILAIPFVLAAFPLLFTGPDPKITILSFSNSDLLISQPGLIRFTSIAVKSWLSLQAAIILSMTTPFSSIAFALRSLRFPKLLVGILSLMWRYLFLMIDQALSLLRARSSRSGVLQDRPDLKPGGKLAWRARVAGGLAGNLFLRSLERSDRVYAAMLSRGYDGEQRSLSSEKLENSDWLALLLGLILLIFIFFIGLLTGA